MVEGPPGGPSWETLSGRAFLGDPCLRGSSGKAPWRPPVWEGVKMALLGPWLIRGTPGTLVPPRELRAGRAQKVGFWGPGAGQGPKMGHFWGPKWGPFLTPSEPQAPLEAHCLGHMASKGGPKTGPDSFIRCTFWAKIGHFGPFWAPGSPGQGTPFWTPSGQKVLRKFTENGHFGLKKGSQNRPFWGPLEGPK